MLLVLQMLLATSASPIPESRCAMEHLPSCASTLSGDPGKCCLRTIVEGRPYEVVRACGSGSASGGCSFEVSTFGNGTSLETSEESSFATFLAVMPLERSFFLNEGRHYLTALRRAIPFPARERDPSLKWLLDVIASHRPLENKAFEWVAAYTPEWKKGGIELPAAYSVELGRLEWRRFVRRLRGCDEQARPDTCPPSMGAFLSYFGHNHQRRALQRVASQDGVELWTTAHGVIMRRRDKNSWVFVGDGRLGGGPDKLRWPSIMGADRVDDLVFVKWAFLQEESASYSLVVTNPTDGVVGVLNPSAMASSTLKRESCELPLDCDHVYTSGGPRVMAHRVRDGELEVDLCSETGPARAHATIRQLKAALSSAKPRIP
jgi:hypothetical protein